jgi:multiple sugar transport system permease protein
MVIVAIAFLAPAILMVLTSFKTSAEVLNPSAILPHPWTTASYAKTIKYSEESPFAQWLLNSLLVSTSVTFLVLWISSMSAFAIARLKVRGAAKAITAIVISMMIPGQLFLIPVYLILNWLHWLDTPLALIVPATAGGFGVFMLTQFMRSIPPSLEEAAVIDGCSLWRIYTDICIPLVAPAMATLGIFTFIGSWNDFLGPLALPILLLHRVLAHPGNERAGHRASDSRIYRVPKADRGQHGHQRIEGLGEFRWNRTTLQ